MRAYLRRLYLHLLYILPTWVAPLLDRLNLDIDGWLS